MTTKTELLKIIHQHCMNCCSGSWKDVQNCTSGPNAAPYSTCTLWQFRNGVDPEGPSEAKKEAGRRLSQRKKAKTSM